MKKILFLLFTVSLALSAPADSNAAGNKYVIDSSHANVLWSASHFGFSDVYGRFNDVQGTIFFDEKNPAMGTVNVVIKTSSIETQVPKFTEHLKGADFFKVTEFPEARFKSTEIKVTGKKSGVVEGDLTLLGVTKPVKLKVKLNKVGPNPFSKKRVAGFSAETTIKRSDFGMKYGLPGVSDEVKLIIEVEAIHEEDLLMDIK
jgi:polyisoprenoid-binding protein YceI